MTQISFIDGSKHLWSIRTVNGLVDMHSDDLVHYGTIAILVRIDFLKEELQEIRKEIRPKTLTRCRMKYREYLFHISAQEEI